MMKVIAINGSPRKKWNTATPLQNALDGACKLKSGKSYGKCAVQDGLTPVLEKIEVADALILGSPIYFSTVTGMMRC